VPVAFSTTIILAGLSVVRGKAEVVVPAALVVAMVLALLV
jgi:hypothetical protein